MYISLWIWGGIKWKHRELGSASKPPVIRPIALVTKSKTLHSEKQATSKEKLQRKKNICIIHGDLYKLFLEFLKKYLIKKEIN